MKVVATFEEDKAIHVERFNDKGLSVGARNVFAIDFAKSMMNELPVGSVLEHLSEGHLAGHFESLTDYDVKDFTRFLARFLRTMPLRAMNTLENKVAFEELGRVCFEKLTVMNIDDQETIELATLLLEQLKLQSDSDADRIVLEKLAMVIIGKLLASNKPENEQTLKRLLDGLSIKAKSMMEPSARESLSNLENDLKKYLSFVSTDWLFEQYQARKERSNSNEIISTISTIPKGCSFISVGTSHNSYVFDIAKTGIRVKYGNVAYENVGHPRLLFVIKANNAEVIGMKIVAAKEHDELNESMTVYRYPFAHVFGNGDVCWSGYKGRDIKQMWLLTQEFLTTSNSNHMAGNTRELYESLSNRVFDDSQLRLHQTPLTLKSLL